MTGIKGESVACRACGRLVVIGTGSDHGSYYHEEPTCDWFFEIVGPNAVDHGVQTFSITPDVDGRNAN